MDQLRALRAELRAVAEPDRVPTLQSFFKTGPGEYAEGDVFIGVRVPSARKVARDHRELPLSAALELLASEVHEERLLALLIMVERYRRDPAQRQRIHDAYLDHTEHVNNWDLVDLSAPTIVGEHLIDRPRKELDRLAGSASLWERRIAVVATHALIRRDEIGPTFELAERLLSDEEDLIHKAVGWMLREAGKRDEAAMVAFVERHAPEMPRTMLRYAIERLPQPERRRLMAIR